jgi:hypothetical protein
MLKDVDVNLDETLLGEYENNDNIMDGEGMAGCGARVVPTTVKRLRRLRRKCSMGRRRRCTREHRTTPRLKTRH